MAEYAACLFSDFLSQGIVVVAERFGIEEYVEFRLAVEIVGFKTPDIIADFFDKLLLKRKYCFVGR